MPWREQTLPTEVPHVYAMTFIGRGFLIEPVPVAATHAAHKNLSPSLFAEIIRQVHNIGAGNAATAKHRLSGFRTAARSPGRSPYLSQRGWRSHVGWWPSSYWPGPQERVCRWSG